MTRETKQITLPVSKAVVELKTYITGGEKQELMRFLLKGSKVDMGDTNVKDISIETLLSANDKAFDLLVVSINGNKENIVSTINDLRVKDYDFLKSEVDKISNDSDFLAEGQK